MGGAVHDFCRPLVVRPPLLLLYSRCARSFPRRSPYCLRSVMLFLCVCGLVCYCRRCCAAALPWDCLACVLFQQGHSKKTRKNQRHYFPFDDQSMTRPSHCILPAISTAQPSHPQRAAIAISTVAPTQYAWWWSCHATAVAAGDRAFHGGAAALRAAVERSLPVIRRRFGRPAARAAS